MKVLGVALLFVFAVLAEKALARPSEVADDDGYQEDEDHEDEDVPEAPFSGPPPVIRTQPMTLTPKPGETVILPCEVEPRISIIWMKNSAPLFMTNQKFYGDRLLSTRPILHVNNNSLELRDVQPRDSGNYVCKVNEDLALVHRLNVFAPPHIVSTEPADKHITLQQGEHVTFNCNATGFPEPKVTWTGKERNLPGNQHQRHGNNLHFSNVTSLHSGTYICNATNELGSAQASFTLDVINPPQVELEKPLLNTNIGQTAEIACIVHAYPPAEVKWYLNGAAAELHPNSHVQLLEDREYNSRNSMGRRHVLRIEKVVESDLGTYYCSATNDKGSARRATRLAGVPTPATLKEVTYHKGRPVLFWTVESLAPITKYELMYRQKEPVTEWTVVELPAKETSGNVHKVEYELKNVEAAEYETKLRSHNSFGWSNFSEKYPFRAESSRLAEAPVKEEAGNGGPVHRISFGLLVGAIAVLLTSL